MLRKLPTTKTTGQPSWSVDDLAALRDHLKTGTTLIETARALSRETGDVESKIAELFRPGQGLRRRPPEAVGL